MKLLRIISRGIRDAFKSVFRNFSLSLASISCTIITLLLVAIGILVSYNVKKITTDIENELTIVAFVKREASSEEEQLVKQDLETINNVDTIVFNSKQEIKESMQLEDETFNTIMSSWSEEENPLQSTYVVTVKDVDFIDETASSIRNIENIDLVKYGESMVNKLIKGFDIVEKICIGIVVGLVVVTAFLISNTIKLTIFSRRVEIDIMRLVGTSNFVIKLPFLIEGFVLGVLGSILPILATIFGYSYLYERFGGKILDLEMISLAEPMEIVFVTSLILLIIGSLVGMFGSYKAVRKYLTI